MTEPLEPPELTPEQLTALSGGLVPASTPGLAEKISATLAGIRRLCGWHVFPVKEETITVDAFGGTLLRLPTMHVEDISRVVIRGVEVDSSNFGWSQSGMLELYDGEFPGRFRSVEVTLRHGFDQAPDLLRIAAEIVQRSVLAGTGGNVSVGGISVGAPAGGGGGGSITPMATEWRIIDQYKLREWP